MTGVDLAVAGQFGQAFQRAEDVVRAAAGEVRAAAAVAEEGVAGEQHPILASRLGAQKRDGARRVARRLDDGEGEGAQADVVPVFEIGGILRRDEAVIVPADGDAHVRLVHEKPRLGLR